MRRVFHDCDRLLIIFVRLPTERKLKQQIIFGNGMKSHLQIGHIPGYFIPKKIHVIGLGDSLTQGVGDELKKRGYFGRVTGKMMEWKGVKDVDACQFGKAGSKK